MESVPAAILRAQGSLGLAESPSLCECEVQEGLTTDLTAGLLKAHLQLEMSRTDCSLPRPPKPGTASRKPGRLRGTAGDLKRTILFLTRRSRDTAAELHRGGGSTRL